MEDLKQGLQILATRGRTYKFIQACQNCSDELVRAGYQEEASEILQLLGSTLGGNVPIPHAETKDQHGTLSLVCAFCGGTLQSDEVDWIDNATAECPWCGSSIPTK